MFQKNKLLIKRSVEYIINSVRDFHLTYFTLITGKISIYYAVEQAWSRLFDGDYWLCTFLLFELQRANLYNSFAFRYLHSHFAKNKAK